MKNKVIIDWHLIIPGLIIVFLGFSILNSISKDIFIFQFISFLFGSILFYLFSRFNYLNHKSFSNLYLIISIIFLSLPFIFGIATRGSVRWIQIGSLTLQPSELTKPFLIIVFSSFLSKAKTSINIKTFIFYLGLLILPSFLIFKQPDLGSSLVLFAIWLGIFLSSNLSFIWLISLFFGFATLGPLAFKFLKSYQKQRIASFLNPYQNPSGSGYQLIQSMIAVGSGKIFGLGLGHGTQSQLAFLPERHSDFIFASLAEEMGLIGSLILITSLFFLLKRILKIAQSAPDKFSYYICIGVFSMIFFQSFVNIAMNLGVMPITGITLPLVSAGGSSILAVMISLGMVHNISSHSISKKSLEIK
ncbi:MAG: FtsW/RodA/SpoVE family cell cycle protein [Patescibacteria group bacterium]|nr:FtsW/RodA/SpoVE family cell cycle protein [Patescibacteria group bacterium]